MSFNSQLSGDLSVAQGDSSRRIKPATGRGVVEFFVGSKRSNYSTPVYLFIVFLVSVILWGVMPWIVSAYGDLNLEDRIAALEARPAGSGGAGAGAAALAEMKQLKSEVESNLAAIKGVKAEVESTISAFQKAQEVSSSANAGDITGVTSELARLDGQLQTIAKGNAKLDSSIGGIETKLSTVEGKMSKISTIQTGLESGIKDTKAGVTTATSKITDLEQKIKDAHYSLDGLASTVSRKCGSSSSLWGGGGSGASKEDKPNFALRCAGAIVEDVKLPTSGLVDLIKSSVYRVTGINFDHDNPTYNALDSANEPGQCWCFQGQEANMTIRLITPMVPTEFFIHHIFMEYYHETKIDMGTAAPKDFTVVGVDGEGEHVLGDYTYDSAGQKEKGLQQVFPIHQHQTRVFERIKVVFRSSAWSAGRKYTCVYQFGVHGSGVPEIN